jgi:hypothetical protein
VVPGARVGADGQITRGGVLKQRSNLRWNLQRCKVGIGGAWAPSQSAREIREENGWRGRAWEGGKDLN